MTRRQRNRRGSVIVESALVGTALFALVLVTFDFAIALFLKATFEHAAREGARYAITYQTHEGLGHDASIKRVVVRNSMGFLKPNDVSVRYYDPTSANPDAEIPAPAGNSPDNVVVVGVSGFSWAWIFPRGLFGGGAQRPLSITAQSADRMEALGAGQMRPPR